MEQLTLETLKELTQHEQNPKISAFMPTFRAGPDVQQNHTRYKNLLTQAARGLADRELSVADTDAILAPARALLDDGEFWKHPTDGLAIFASADGFYAYPLPFPVEERLVISQHYALTPILPMFTSNGRYYILALSQNQIRLFGATRYDVWPVTLPETAPADMDEALQHETMEKQLQMHSAGGQGTTGGIFHGSGEVDSKERVQRYLNLVDDALKPLLREQRVPLVLAGVEYLHPLYREVSEYAHIMPEGIVGNPENMSAEELHAQSLPLVEAIFQQDSEAAKEQYGNLSATEKTSDNLRDVVPAAVYARIDTLLVDTEAIAWGSFDPADSKVVVRREGPRTYEDLSLIDFAAMHTLLNGGRVIPLAAADMPSDSPVAAVLRY